MVGITVGTHMLENTKQNIIYYGLIDVFVCDVFLCAAPKGM